MSRTMLPRTSDGIVVAKIFRCFGNLDDFCGRWGGERDHPHAAAE